ncbi:MaoC family dehydratase [Sphingomonas donggukensis]|uniref:MaoC family dehydratase n=1 Tax=Sphingomonas donggukensis TaxID=2949093 RepID=A0ABY4TUK3_9SPHN|nr:MaoC family dehydratase [Sphingomonas donggukensis]URW75967.1 MaoC family dehydratase [Sphingomonas donggukensis]
MRYFEDLAVGDTNAFGSYEVTRDEVLDFAGKYDPQPFHLSDEGAEGTHFGRLAASGWHTCAMTMAMIVRDMQANDTGGLGAAGIDELRWLKPVYPGDVLRVESEVVETRAFRSKPDMGSALTRSTVFNQADEPVMSFLATGLYRRREGAAS